MYGLKVLGLFDNSDLSADTRDWKTLLLEKNKDLQVGSNGEISLESLKAAMKSRGVQDVAAAANAVRWLGMLSDRPLPVGSKTVLDALSSLLESRLTFKSGEKDMVAMYHTIVGRLPDGSRDEVTSSLLAFGLTDPKGETAMAATVGYTAAAAAELILMDRVAGRGVLIPTTPDIYEPLLKRLQDFGITWSETVNRTPR